MREFRFVLTPFCNYQCFFCHGESGGKAGLLLNPSDYQFIGKVGKDSFGWGTATLTGGEPLISPIFQEVCERLKGVGLDLTVVTNASLLARPQEVLKNVSQVNISLHTMNPKVYGEVTKVGYPLGKILDTIVTTRARLPDLIIHINYTVVKGLNDKPADYEAVLKFARDVRAMVKFIDLSTTDENLATDAEEITQQLHELGFVSGQGDAWRFCLTRGQEQVVVAKCPFNGKHTTEPVRDVFVDSDGVLYTSYSGALSASCLNEIKSHDGKRFVEKVQVLLPGGG